MMLARGLLLLVLALAGLVSGTRTSSHAKPFSRHDIGVLESASLRLGHQSRSAVLRWLRHNRSAVRWAGVGRDGRTVDIRFRDGQESLIVPNDFQKVGMSGRIFRPQLRSPAPARAPARAAVLEPFATELGLGPNAGDAEVQELEQAGFAVDQAYDTAVTVESMANLSSYNAVYMHTHSGVTAGGDGVLMTGEFANGDPAVQPLLDNGSVVILGVAGSHDAYYGITSRYVSSYMGHFPQDSLLYLDGCALLAAPVFLQTLAAQGVGVTISWDHNAATVDEYFTASAFFQSMDRGQTVSGAITTIKSYGFGKSTVDGTTATLGFFGDGSITLARAAGQPAPPPPLPTATSVRTIRPVPTSTSVPPAPTATGQPTATKQPTSTPRPTSTSTAVPTATSPLIGPVTGSLAAALVKPGQLQTITLKAASNTALTLNIHFPNGDQQQIGNLRTDAAGNLTYAYKQPASKITRSDRDAMVEALVPTAQSEAEVTPHLLLRSQTVWTGRYLIGFATIDVSAQPRAQSVGKRVSIWVHTKARHKVTVLLHFLKGKDRKLHGKTASNGWARVRYKIGKHRTSGTHRTVRVRASVGISHKTHRTSTTFAIK